VELQLGREVHARDASQVLVSTNELAGQGPCQDVHHQGQKVDMISKVWGGKNDTASLVLSLKGETGLPDKMIVDRKKKKWWK
jgi:hypothetical protein